MSRFVHVLEFVTSHPWAMLPARFSAMLELIELRASGVRLSDDEIEARLASARSELAADQRRGKRRAGAVAVIPVYGPIIPKANLFSAMSGGTALSQLKADVQDALDDEDVSSILLDMDSPGGIVDGVPEAAAFLRQAREQKPLAAIANSMSASAAYWLASSTSEISVTTSGIVGSIGVFLAHTEFSKADEMAGEKTTLIRAGKFKAEANDVEPLSEEAQAHLQEEVDYYYDLFVTDVASGRGVKKADVRNGYGEGRALTAKPALDAGLVDRIETFEQAAARLVKGGGRLGRTTAFSVPGGPVADLQVTVDGEPLEDPGLAPDDVPDGVVDDALQTEVEVDAQAPAEYYRRRAAIRDRDHASA